MPITGTKTLAEFETQRQLQKFIPYTSDISDVGESKVELITIRRLPSNPRFDLEVKSKNLRAGDDFFFIIGDQMRPDRVYRSMTINALATLLVSKTFVITGNDKIDPTSVPGKLTVNGKLHMLDNSHLAILNRGVVEIGPDGTLYVEPAASIDLINDGKLIIHGTVYLPWELMEPILTHPNVIVYPSAIVKITETPGNRPFSMTDYLAEINQIYQPVGAHSSRSMSVGTAVASFERIAGDIDQPSHILQMCVVSGKVILGDRNLMLLGLPAEIEPYRRSICDLIVNDGAELVIGDTFMNAKYQSPCLQIGRLDAKDIPGKLIIHGTVTITGDTSSIKFMPYGTILIEANAKLVVTNGAKIVHERLTTIFIDGTLIIDELDQIFDEDSDWMSRCEFGPNGKVIITNALPVAEWERRVLLKIPEGIKTHGLTHVFGKHLDRVEFHIPERCGIEIDTDMSPMHLWDNWYNGVRLARAIAEGWLVWHSGAFIQTDRSVMPWLTVKRGLGQITKFFKSTKPTERERLQELADRLRYAGAGDMVFLVTDDVNALKVETTLRLSECDLEGVSYNPMNDTYGVTTSAPGQLYLVNPSTGTEPENIVMDNARVIDIPDTKRTTFTV